jgi:hypothetical protein
MDLRMSMMGRVYLEFTEAVMHYENTKDRTLLEQTIAKYPGIYTADLYDQILADELGI